MVERGDEDEEEEEEEVLVVCGVDMKLEVEKRGNCQGVAVYVHKRIHNSAYNIQERVCVCVTKAGA